MFDKRIRFKPQLVKMANNHVVGVGGEGSSVAIRGLARIRVHTRRTTTVMIAAIIDGVEFHLLLGTSDIKRQRGVPDVMRDQYVLHDEQLRVVERLPMRVMNSPYYRQYCEAVRGDADEEPGEDLDLDFH